MFYAGEKHLENILESLYSSYLQSMKEKKYKHVRNEIAYYFPETLGVVYVSIPKGEKIFVSFFPIDFVGFYSS